MMFDVAVGWRAATNNLRFSLINWLGLSLALACAILIAAFVVHEYSYERWIPDATNVAIVVSRVSTPGAADQNLPVSQFLLAPSAQRDLALANVARAARVWPQDVGIVVAQRPMRRAVLFADPFVFEVFGLQSAVGDAPAALTRPHEVVLSRAIASEWFGDARSALGREVRLTVDGRLAPYVVGAVIEDAPGPSHLDFSIIAPLDRDDWSDLNAFDSWASLTGHTYLRLHRGVDMEAVSRVLSAIAQRGVAAQFGAHPISVSYTLLPIARLHMDAPELARDLRTRTDRAFVLGLAGVGLVIATLAAVNYAALSTALAARRAREVALCRVVGATSFEIVFRFVAETILIAMAAMATGLALALAIAAPFGASLGFDFTIAALLGPVGFGGLAAAGLVFGVVAGLGPALTLARINVARTLAGGGAFARRAASRQRFAVVSVQYAVSVALGALTLIGFAQIEHIRASGLGYSPQGLVVLNNTVAGGEALLDALRAQHSVVAISTGSNGPGVGDRNEETLTRRNGVRIHAQRFEIGDNYFDVYGTPLLAGRDLTGVATTSPAGSNGEIIINQSAVHAMGFTSSRAAIGQSVTISETERRIVGVAANQRFMALRAPVLPTYYVRSSAPLRATAIRFAGLTPKVALEEVSRIWQALYPDIPLDAWTADDAILDAHRTDRMRNMVLASFSLIALVLAAFGAFALSAYAAERAGREMAIRRVVGADEWTIAALHVRRAMAPAFVGALVATPIAFVLAERWLAGFETRVQFMPAYIVLAGAAALMLAALASLAEAFSLARQAPAMRLRSG